MPSRGSCLFILEIGILPWPFSMSCTCNQDCTLCWYQTCKEIFHSEALRNAAELVVVQLGLQLVVTFHMTRQEIPGLVQLLKLPKVIALDPTKLKPNRDPQGDSCSAHVKLWHCRPGIASIPAITREVLGATTDAVEYTGAPLASARLFPEFERKG